MTKSICFICTLLILTGMFVLPAVAATPVLFRWSYSAEDEANISNYRIYRDGIGADYRILQPSKELREVQYLEEDDQKPHVYFISAYRLEDDAESPGSVFAWFRPTEPDPPIIPGKIIIEIPAVTATITTKQ